MLKIYRRGHSKWAERWNSIPLVLKPLHFAWLLFWIQWPHLIFRPHYVPGSVRQGGDVPKADTDKPLSLAVYILVRKKDFINKCCDSNVKMPPPQVHAFEHLVCSLWCYLGRLQNLQKVGLATGSEWVTRTGLWGFISQPCFLSILCFLISDEVWLALRLPCHHDFPTVMDCTFWNCEPT